MSAEKTTSTGSDSGGSRIFSLPLSMHADPKEMDTWPSNVLAKILGFLDEQGKDYRAWLCACRAFRDHKLPKIKNYSLCSDAFPGGRFDHLLDYDPLTQRIAVVRTGSLPRLQTGALQAISGSQDNVFVNRLGVWDINRRRFVRVVDFPLTDGLVKRADLQSKRVLTQHQQNTPQMQVTIRLCDLDTGKEVHRLVCPGKQCFTLEEDFRSGVLFCNLAGSLRDISTGLYPLSSSSSALGPLVTFRSSIGPLRYCDDSSRKRVIVTDLGKVDVHDRDSGNKLLTVKSVNELFSSMYDRKRGLLYVPAIEDQRMIVSQVDVQTPKVIKKMELYKTYASFTALHIDTSVQLLFAHIDDLDAGSLEDQSRMVVMDLSSGKVITSFSTCLSKEEFAPNTYVKTIDYDPKTDVILTEAPGGRGGIQFWSVKGGKPLRFDSTIDFTVAQPRNGTRTEVIWDKDNGRLIYHHNKQEPTGTFRPFESNPVPKPGGEIGVIDYYSPHFKVPAETKREHKDSKDEKKS